VHDTLLAAEELDASVVNMRFVKPLDKDMVLSMVKTHDALVTVEDNVVTGGAGSAVNELLANAKLSVKTLNLGLPDRFMNHGSREQLLSEAGLDAEGIAASVSHLLPQGDCGTISSKVISKQ
jgi:1-deoxy-D-xylulose-5-phosphate synthase